MGKLIRLRESDEAIAGGLGMTVEAFRARKAFLLWQVGEVGETLKGSGNG